IADTDHIDRNRSTYRAITLALRRTGFWEGEINERRRNGEPFPEWLQISSVLDEKQRVIRYVGMLSDLTSRKEAEERVQFLSNYDRLTGLPNRALFRERLQRALTLARLNREKAALLMIDLDRFKPINESLGHEIGDRLLKLAAERICRCGVNDENLARVGGDEFTLVLENCGAEAQIGVLCQKLINMMKKPFLIDGHELLLGASIGISVFPNPGQEAQSMINQAEMAVHQAKRSGGNNFQFYRTGMQMASVEQLALETSLRKAIFKNEFVVHYQPKMDLADSRISSVEALVRWQHPLRGLLTPAAFIAQAEHAGLIHTLDQQVLAQACAQLARWAETPEFAHLSLSVNLSAHLLYQDNFVEGVLELLEGSGADPARLKLELTETLLLDNMPEAIARMTRLKQHGIRFAIDDFGTGYSSMSYLQQLPLDQLKIDQTFIRRLPDDSSSLTIVRAICALATGLGLEVIAEGVESEPQWAMLLANGCHRYQGYLFGRPLSADAFEELVRSTEADDGVTA
ncbi:MAG TPA: hypothetical protein DD399_17540, partial [Alcanivorax sp.]|nr:hypothetical protein [Alcanivorax sp.]